MKYQIGEVSDILGLSPEMIRYYERQNVIQPQRNIDNNYRYYTSQDLFVLMEILQFKDLDINIRDFIRMKSSDYSESFSGHLAQYRNKLKKELLHKEQLLLRTEELIGVLETCKYNVGKYWVKKRGPFLQIPLMRSQNDEYRVIRSAKRSFDLFTSEIYPFFNNEVEFQAEEEIWYNCIRESYAQNLDMSIIPPTVQISKKESIIVVCTIVEMGDMGSFSRDCLSPLLRYADKNHYMQTGPIRGVLCSRGVEEGSYRRYLELQMPVKP